MHFSMKNTLKNNRNHILKQTLSFLKNVVAMIQTEDRVVLKFFFNVVVSIF